MNISDFDFIVASKLEPFIDVELTEVANSVDKYLIFNQFTPTEGLSVEQVKRFRTWLAETILTFGIEDDDTKHMLKYYAGGMYDDVVQALTKFGSTSIALSSVAQGCGCGGSTNVKESVIATTIKSSKCGCAGNQNASSLYLQQLTNCDPLWIYKKNIYLKMVEVFSNIDFWMQFENEFIQEFKAYIDSVIKMNLSLVSSAWQSDFVDCGCVNDQIEAQKRNIARLERLSKSLQYMYDQLSGTGSIAGHKNFIQTAFNEWAIYLYESMEW